MFIFRIFSCLTTRMRWYRACSSSARYAAYLRRRGIAVGSGNVFRAPATLSIDLSRPSLITIGSDNDFNHHFTLMTHDWGSRVFRKLYHDFIPSSGAVTIGSNVVFGRNVTVLKGVTIGDNCIIAAGAVVTHSIPAGSVAGGIPAKVLCGVDQYYEKRKRLCVQEALEYARSIQQRFNRRPVPGDFKEEFPLFVNGGEADRYPELPITRQLGPALEQWNQTHRAPFRDFEEFLREAGL